MHKKTSFENFLLEGLNIDINTLRVNEPVDVSSLNKGILSFNEKNKIDEFKKVLKVVRKNDDFECIINDILKTSRNHKIYVKFDLEKEASYFEIEHLLKIKGDIFILSQNGWEKCNSIKINKSKKIPIYDLEVEDNHNYYSDGILSHNTIYGSPITTTGGNGLKFAASIRLEIKKSTQLKNGDEVYGNKTSIKVVKNKVAPPFKTAEFDIIYGKGVDNVGEVIDIAVEQGIIQKNGAWFKYNGDNISQGRAGLIELLKDNVELFEIIKNQI